MNESLPPVEQSTPHAEDPYAPVRDRDAPLFVLPEGWEQDFHEFRDGDVSLQFRGPGSLPADACVWAERVLFTVDADKCRPSDGKRVYTVTVHPRDSNGDVPDGAGNILGPPEFRLGNGDRQLRDLVDTLEDAAKTVVAPEAGDTIMLDGRRYTYEEV